MNKNLLYSFCQVGGYGDIQATAPDPSAMRRVDAGAVQYLQRLASRNLFKREDISAADACKTEAESDR